MLKRALPGKRVTANIRRAEEFEARARALEVLHRAGEALRQREPVKRFGESIIKELEQQLAWQRGSVWRVNQSTGALELIAHSDKGLAPENVEEEFARVKTLVPRLGCGITGWVVLHGATVRLGRVADDPRYASADPEIQSELCVPIKIEDRTIGALNIESRLADAFDEYDELLVETLASGMGLAILNAELVDELNTSKARYRALATRLQAVREEERTILAREIHDELGQSLAALKLGLWSLKTCLPTPDSSGSTGGQGKVDKIIDLVDVTMLATTRLVAKLRPAILDDLGLLDALSWQAREFRKTTGISCEFDCTVAEVVVAPERATAIFRILQEALTNVARHANATKVRLVVRAEAATLLFEVNDDGHGVPPDVLERSSSFGVLGMRERVDGIGGELSIGAVHPHGTCVRLTVKNVECSPAVA